MMAENVACGTRKPFPPHLYIVTQMQCDPLPWQLHSDFGDFNNGVCHVTNIIIAESNNSDMEFLPQQTFCFRPVRSGRSSEMPIMTMSVASDLGPSLVQTLCVFLFYWNL